MVKPLFFIKSKYFSKRELVLAITMIVIVFSFITNSIFAAQTKISAEQAERIKFALDVVGTTSQFGSILVDGGGLMKALNTVIKGGQTATDVTYGLLVLSAINEMEFIDLVLSQDYKDIAKEYFTNILEERVNLRSYWKGVGFDIPKVLSGNITGPMGALTLNTFEMTDKVILILTEFETLKKGRQYDGLWRYFDERRNGESHQGAWELAEPQVGWAANSISFRRNVDRTRDAKELEQQFATLYEKWAPHTTPFGVSEKYKEQVKSDLRNTLAFAIEESTPVKPVYAKEPSLWEKFAAQLENIKNAVANLASQVNPFRAGPIVELSALEEAGEKSTIVEKDEFVEAEDLDDILEEQDILSRESVVEEPVVLEEDEPEEIMEVQPPLIEPEATTTEPVGEEVVARTPAAEPEPEPENETGSDLVSCRKGDAGAARQYRVLINEVAWMGNQDSFNNEWIELKNIFGLPINLAGWQIQDKDQQIKLIFKEGSEIPAGGYLLLERSKDYTGALNNTNEALYLFDNNCQLEDEVLAMPDWPAGDNYSKNTMQRFNVLSWYSGPATAGAENSPPPAILVHPSAPASEPTPVPVESSGGGATASVVINEIAWAGTKANSADEWMEFFNNTASAIDLTGWKIKKGNEDWITFSTSTILAQGYYLLERTDDNTISNVSADQFFTGGLNNAGEKLELINASGNTVDTIDALTGWFAGAASPNYISMERVNATSSNWASNNRITRNGIDSAGNAINGTPRAQNSVSKPFTQIANGLTVTEGATLTYLGSPYLVEGPMVVSGAKLTVEPGVTVRFKHVGAPNQISLLKVEDGILDAVGTVDRKITFTSSSTQPQAGNWDGLYLKNSTSTLTNAVVQYGGMLHRPSSYEFTPFTYGAVYIDGGNAQISNSLIEKSGTYGLWLKNSTSSQIINAEFKENSGTAERPAAVFIENSSPTIKNSLLQNNTIGILTENYSAPTIKDNQFIQNTTPIQVSSLLADIGTNTFQNNNINGVLVRGFGFSGLVQEINWKKITNPYFVDAALTIPSGSTLRIEPGVEIRLKNNGLITAEGNLVAQGTSQSKIVFTGASEVPGAWKRIKFSASSTGSILEYVAVSYGGYFDQWGGGRYGAVMIEGLNFIIKDSIFENNRLAVELINAGFASSSQGVSIKKNEVGIYVTAGSSPNLSAVTFGTGEDVNAYNILP